MDNRSVSPILRTSLAETVEIEIARPRSDVWAFLTDFERIPEWLGEFETAHAETPAPTGRGTIIRCTINPGARSATFEVVAWEPPRWVAWDGPPLRWAGGSARPRGSHELSDAGSGRTLVVSRYEPELTGTQALLRPYLRRWLRRQRAEDAQKLKALLETGAVA
jgi:uncharacterized protein YndB with AHSA1/START domain